MISVPGHRSGPSPPSQSPLVLHLRMPCRRDPGTGLLSSIWSAVPSQAPTLTRSRRRPTLGTCPNRICHATRRQFSALPACRHAVSNRAGAWRAVLLTGRTLDAARRSRVDGRLCPVDFGARNRQHGSQRFRHLGAGGDSCSRRCARGLRFGHGELAPDSIREGGAHGFDCLAATHPSPFWAESTHCWRHPRPLSVSDTAHPLDTAPTPAGAVTGATIRSEPPKKPPDSSRW